MKRICFALLSASALIISTITIAELNNPGGIGGLESLRGASELEATRPADDFKKYPKEQVLESSSRIAFATWPTR